MDTTHYSVLYHMSGLEKIVGNRGQKFRKSSGKSPAEYEVKQRGNMDFYVPLL